MIQSRTVVHTTSAPTPAGAYEQAIAQAGFLFTSGIVGRNAATGVVPDDFPGEVRQALANLDAVLSAGGASRASVIKTMCFLTDTADFAAFNEEYVAFFGEVLPARSTVGVALAGGYRFEVEAVAAVASEGDSGA